MRDLLHHIDSVDPVAADEASGVGNQAPDIPDKEHSLHGQDICTNTHHQQVTKRCVPIKVATQDTLKKYGKDKSGHFVR